MSQPATPNKKFRSGSVPAGHYVSRRRPAVLAAKLAAGLVASALAAGIAGCEADSFLDPSVVGRWEHTPTVVPILERIDVIERDTGQFVDVTQVQPDDLLPEPTEYRVGAGDLLRIEILDFIVAGQMFPLERVVSPNGYLDIPQIGDIYIVGMSRSQVEVAISQAIRDAGLLDDPLVTVQVPGQRQATFSVFGAIERPGTYPIFEPDYRVLRAVTDAGGINPVISKIYIIRQVSLVEPTRPRPDSGPPATLTSPTGRSPDAPAPGPNLIDLIDELTAPPPAPQGDSRPTMPPTDDPAQDPPEDLDDPSFASLGGGGQNGSSLRAAAKAHSRTAMAAMQDGQEPPIDLVEEQIRRPAVVAPTGPTAPSPGRWVFLNGEWVQTLGNAPMAPGTGLPDSGAPPVDTEEPSSLVTQRVIEVPTAPLLQGVAKYNVVVRPGDVISVPGPSQGFVYVMGPGISRAGTYQLPLAGKLTLQRLIASAGGLNLIAIPERVDLTRVVAENRQATIRVNLRAIAEGTQPDLLLKPDDLINIGTNFWATPLAIIRGGFRTSYGFGFLLDRNFGSDVFGAPPENLR